MSVVGWDIDGTLCRTPDLDYEDEAAVREGCQPIRAAVAAALRAHAGGHRTVLVTARGPVLRNVTLQQAREWLGGIHVEVAMRPGLIWDPERMARDKEVHLRRLGVGLFIGDSPADETAALRAGARFVWAHRVHTYGYAAIRGHLEALSAIELGVRHSTTELPRAFTSEVQA